MYDYSSYTYETDNPFVGFVAIVIGVLEIIALWKMFEKAGADGWKSIIPIYNVVVFFKIVGLSPLLLLLLFIPIVNIFGVIYVVIKLCGAVARAYGQDTSFAVLLFFLAPVGYLMLGFGSAQYVGRVQGRSVHRAVHTSAREKIDQSYR